MKTQAKVLIFFVIFFFCDSKQRRITFVYELCRLTAKKINMISLNTEYFGDQNRKLLIISSKNCIRHKSELVVLFSDTKKKTISYQNANFCKTFHLQIGLRSFKESINTALDSIRTLIIFSFKRLRELCQITVLMHSLLFFLRAIISHGQAKEFSELIEF